MADKIFADGLFIKLPRDGSPAFVLGSLSFDGEKFKKFIDAHMKANGLVDVDMLLAKETGKPYGVLNQFEPKKPESLQEDNSPIEYPAEELNPDDIPF